MHVLTAYFNSLYIALMLSSAFASFSLYFSYASINSAAGSHEAVFNDLVVASGNNYKNSVNVDVTILKPSTSVNALNPSLYKILV